MSMSRDDIAKHIEQGNYDVFNKLAKEQYVTVANNIIDCFCDEFLHSSSPERWIEFMRCLYTQPPAFLKNSDPPEVFGVTLKMPAYMISVLRDVLISNERSFSNDQRCTQLLMMVLHELEQTPNFNLSGNRLGDLREHLLNNEDAHITVLNLFKQLNESEKKKAYGYLLDCYIQYPGVLYKVYLQQSDPTFLDHLSAATNDINQQWYFAALKGIFQAAENDSQQDDVWEICHYVAGIVNELSFDSSEEEKQAYLRLKMISARSDLVLDKVYELIRGNVQAVEKFDALKQEDGDKVLRFAAQMKRLLDGFGKLRYEDGLLNAAQTAARKKYSYNPVILKQNEISDFFDTVSKIKTPTRARFVLASSHWIAGDIEIDVDGFARIALFDSLGHNSLSIYQETLNVISLASKYLPNCEVYLPKEKRQHSSRGCSVFSQDDAAHLFNLEQYLQMNLFDFFANQKNPVIELSNGKSTPIRYYSCSYPLALMRTAQTSKYMNAVKEGKHTLPNIKVNKREELFTESAGNFFKPRANNARVMQNTRLEYELVKMAKQIALYLLSHNEATIAQQINKFTLANFKKITEAKKVVDNVEDDNAPLLRAIRDGESADALNELYAGVSPYEKNARGRSAMDFAIHATQLSKDLANYLLMRAMQADDELMAERLLQRGADPNGANVRKIFGEYPLHLAVRTENFMQIKLLLKYDARVDVEDGSEHYPIEMAFDNYNLLMIILLLQDGKNVSAMDVEGSVYDALENKNWGETVPFLMSADAGLAIEGRSRRMLEENIMNIYAGLMSQLNELDDNAQRSHLLEMAADPRKLLGFLIASNPSVDALMAVELFQSKILANESQSSSPKLPPLSL